MILLLCVNLFSFVVGWLRIVVGVFLLGVWCLMFVWGRLLCWLGLMWYLWAFAFGGLCFGTCLLQVVVVWLVFDFLGSLLFGLVEC